MLFLFRLLPHAILVSFRFIWYPMHFVSFRFVCYPLLFCFVPHAISTNNRCISTTYICVSTTYGCISTANGCISTACACISTACGFFSTACACILTTCGCLWMHFDYLWMHFDGMVAMNAMDAIAYFWSQDNFGFSLHIWIVHWHTYLHILSMYWPHGVSLWDCVWISIFNTDREHGSCLFGQQPLFKW
jgi:hypothetical protein